MSVSLDGERRAPRASTAAPLPVDPGDAPDRARGSCAARASSTTRARSRGRARSPGRRCALRRARAPAREPRAPVPPLAWALGGVGLAGLATWGAVGLVALYAHPGLESTLSGCKPGCPSRDVSTVRTRFAVADVAAGIGHPLARRRRLRLLHPTGGESERSPDLPPGGELRRKPDQRQSPAHVLTP